jgi:hypothetical protein
MKSKLSPYVIAVIALLAAVVSIVISFEKPSYVRKEILVTHGVIVPLATSGTGVGTVRTFYIDITVDGKTADSQYLIGTLTTYDEGVNGDQEIRGSNLILVLGAQANQIVIGGVSLYAPAGSTLAVGAETIRPIIGGSGLYEGAVGQVVSKNSGDNGWSHVLNITVPN